MRSSCSVMSCGVPSVAIVVKRAERDLALPEVQRQDGAARLEARLFDRGAHARVSEQPLEQGRGLRAAVGGSIGLDAADEVAHHVVPVHQEGAQQVRTDQGVGQIDRNFGREWPEEELDQAYRPGIRLDEVPAGIDHHGRERLEMVRVAREGG